MFENITITQNCKSEIISAINNSRLPHSIILEGTNEENRFLAAKEIAKALVCHGENRPCNECSSCIKCNASSHPDIYFTAKADNTPFIKVDEIREIRQKAMVFPNESEKSVFIIREAQNMNVQAQNALLKIFEEPSAHVCFILTCNSKSSLLDTIISRASSYFLGEEEYFNTADKENEKAGQKASDLLHIFSSGDELAFLKSTAEFQRDKPFFRLTLSAAIPIIRDAILLKSGSKDFISSYKSTSSELSKKFTLSQLMGLIENTQKLIDSFDRSANFNLLLTRLSSVYYELKSI